MRSVRPAHTSNSRRRGLTLIELVVVLVILTALGAILVPVIGSAITRAHLATCLTNFPEVTRMLNQASNLQGTLGDGWTNPIASGDFGAGAPLTDDQIAALADLGLENFTTIDTSIAEYNVTFNNGVEPVDFVATPAPLTDTTNVVVLSAAQVTESYLPPAEAGQQYVFFAIDKSWTLLGTVTPEPPVHFGDTPGALPDEVYSRWGAIFLVDDGDGAIDGDGSASFQKVTVHIDGAFETADNHSAVYWQDIDTQE